MNSTIAKHRVILSLGVASAAAIAMLVARFVVSHRFTHAYLASNLVLAWIPLILATIVFHGRFRWTTLSAIGAAWLLFFPNAPYLVTDLVHLRERPPVALWFDILLFQFFIWIALCLAFASLQRMQAVVAQRLGTPVSYIFSAVALGLAGFGIYLGRFRRWNSWDTLFSPLDLIQDVLNILFNPFDHRTAVTFSTGFWIFLFLSYLTMQALSLPEEHPERRSRREQ